ncbi:MAG: hypothetical protein ACP5R5_09455 [Armatimonadota bacterium]
MLRRSKLLIPVIVLAAEWGACSAVWSGSARPVNVWRILKEHRPTVVTTEPAQKLERIWMKWGIPPLRVMPISEFPAKKDSKDELPKDGDVLFVIDRNKRELIGPLVEALLPLSTSAIGRDEVVSYVSKTARNRSSRFANGWEILVSSPNERWVYDELEHAPEVFNVEVREDEPTRLHWFRVRPLRIVSTEGKPDWLLSWMRDNCTRIGLGDVLEPEIVEWESFDPSAFPPMDTLFLINRNKLGGQETAIAALLPHEMRKWFSDGSSRTEWAIQREVAKNDDGQERTTIAIIAPCTAHLRHALALNPKVWEIPETLAKFELKDLSAYRDVIVVPKANSGPDSKEARNVGDLCSKVATALANGTGLRCSTRLDLKDVIFTAVEAEAQGRISAGDSQKIRKQAPGATALAIVELASLDERTNYVENEPRRLTELYPEFREPRPSEPSRPDPEEFIPFKGKKYRIVNGSRTNDPHYQEDLRKYERERAEYPEKLRQWERRKEEYEERRRRHQIDWEVSANEEARITLSGNLRIYDLPAADVGAGGRLLYSAFINGTATEKKLWKKDRRVVIGEDGRPDPIELPYPTDEVSSSIRSKAFEEAAVRALEELTANTILPNCGQSSTSGREPAAVSVAEPQTSSAPANKVEVKAKGEVVLSAVGAQLTSEEREKAKQAALLLAVHGLIAEAKRACPGFAMSEDEVHSRTELVRDHWTKATKVYSARFRLTFEPQTNDGVR